MLRARLHFLRVHTCNTHSLSLSLTGEQGAHTLFTGQREREREKERERERESEMERKRERERGRKRERERCRIYLLNGKEASVNRALDGSTYPS